MDAGDHRIAGVLVLWVEVEQQRRATNLQISQRVNLGVAEICHAQQRLQRNPIAAAALRLRP